MAEFLEIFRVLSIAFLIVGWSSAAVLVIYWNHKGDDNG